MKFLRLIIFKMKGIQKGMCINYFFEYTLLNGDLSHKIHLYKPEIHILLNKTCNFFLKAYSEGIIDHVRLCFYLNIFSSEESALFNSFTVLEALVNIFVFHLRSKDAKLDKINFSHSFIAMPLSTNGLETRGYA